jgi:hypothetical protein
MARYMLLICSRPGYWQSLSDGEREALYQEYFRLSDDLQAENRLVNSDELQPSSTAATIRVEDGDPIVTDGPYAETKILGGYYVIEADSREDALRWAERIPSARHGAVEVRPVVER